MARRTDGNSLWLSKKLGSLKEVVHDEGFAHHAQPLYRLYAV